MRKVKIPENTAPPEAWLVEAKRITVSLHSATSDEERKTIIEKYERHWKKKYFRKWLSGIFYNKCWYTEAQDSVSPYHVDHFRPKGRVTDLDGNQRSGYWWLAFQWENYRVSGPLINMKKRDFFPLCEAFYATPSSATLIELEAPLLIDPLTDDANLVSYEMDEGGCVAVAIAESNDSEKKRVSSTVDILGLNDLPQLNENRALKWKECHEKILDYSSASTEPFCMKTLRQALAVQAIQKMISYEREFSSVAIACLNKTAPPSLRAKVYC